MSDSNKSKSGNRLVLCLKQENIAAMSSFLVLDVGFDSCKLANVIIVLGCAYISIA
jgi:hypothetical protein